MTTSTHPARAPAALLGLWTLTGLAGVVTVLGILSIGIFVAPIAVALLVLSVVLTARRPGSWPSVAGLGFALAFGLAWFGVFLGSGSPAEMSCTASPSGEQACTSAGRPYDPEAFGTAAATPWFAASASVALLTWVTYAAGRRLVTRGLVRSP